MTIRFTVLGSLCLLLLAIMPLLAAAETQEATGTGFVVSANGGMVTCAHVVRGAKKITVTLDKVTYNADIVTLDDKHDLAVLVLKKADGLTVLPLANSNAVEAGSDVRVFGYPLSYVIGDSLKQTKGTITGMEVIDGVRTMMTDATVNPGNSGGPLMNEYGEVVGVVNAKLVKQGWDNVGFAVPVNLVKPLLKNEDVEFTEPAADKHKLMTGSELMKLATKAVGFIKVEVDTNDTPANTAAPGTPATPSDDVWVIPGTDKVANYKSLGDFLNKHGAKDVRIRDTFVSTESGSLRVSMNIRSSDTKLCRITMNIFFGVKADYKDKQFRTELLEFVNMLNKEYDIASFSIDNDTDFVLTTQITFTDALTWKELDCGLKWVVDAFSSVLLAHKDEMTRYLD